jgi:hypothetical protein
MAIGPVHCPALRQQALTLKVTMRLSAPILNGS